MIYWLTFASLHQTACHHVCAGTLWSYDESFGTSQQVGSEEKRGWRPRVEFI